MASGGVSERSLWILAPLNAIKSKDCLESFNMWYFSVFSLVLVSIEKMYQQLKAAFDHNSKHLEVRQKYSAARRVFNSLLGVWKCDQTQSFVLGILREGLIKETTKPLES